MPFTASIAGIDPPDYWSQLKNVHTLKKDDAEAAWSRINELIRTKNQSENSPDHRLILSETPSGDYQKIIGFGKNYLLLQKAALGEYLAFANGSPLFVAFEQSLKSHAEHRDRRIQNARSSYNKAVAWLKKKYLKKVKTTWTKKYKSKGKWRSKKVTSWVVPKAKRKTYNSLAAQRRRERDRKIESAQESYQAAIDKERGAFNLKRAVYINSALKIYASATDSKAMAHLSQLKDDALRQAKVIQRLALGNTYLIFSCLQNEKNFEYTAQLTARQKFFAKALSGGRTDELHQALLEKSFFGGPSGVDVDNQDELRYLTGLFRWLRFESALIRNGRVDQVYRLHSVESSIRRGIQAVKTLYRAYFLALDAEDYARALSVLEDIKKNLDEDSIAQSKKAMGFVIYANQKANVYFLQGRFAEARDYQETIGQYSKRTIDKLGKNFGDELMAEIDPISGLDYHPDSNLIKKHMAAYYAVHKEHPATVENLARPFDVTISDDARKELELVAQAAVDDWQKYKEIWTASEKKETLHRLQLAAALATLEIDPAKSIQLSEDVMYKTQAKRMYLIEYYATLLHGWGKLKVKYYRHARVDFTKVNTILTGMKSFDDMRWVVGYGKSMIEIEEYAWLQSGRVTSAKRRARTKSLNYLKYYLRLSLSGFKRVHQPLNLSRMRLYLPPYVTPRNQVQAVEKLAGLYKNKSLARDCADIKAQLDRYRTRGIYARYLERQIKTQQFHWLSEQTGSAPPEALARFRARIARYVWNPSIDKMLRTGL